MKRIILIWFLLFSVLVCTAQNTFKYVIKANGGIEVGLNKVKIDSITSTGGDIKFWHSGAPLTSVPGVGSGTWGAITGTLANQIDLSIALGLKANLNSPTFTGTPVVPGYVPTSTTVNGHALTGNVSVIATDLSLGNVTNESKATMFTSPTFTGSPTVPGYVPTSRTVNGHALTGNISVTAADVSLGNVTNESKATMFADPTFTGVQKVSTTDTLSTKAYARAHGGGGGGGSMIYPGAGIALSTGSAWGTSITNNSTNWNTAYGWGNPAGVYLPIAGTAAKATILETTRAIYGHDFNGSAALTQIIASTYGGTGNGFTKFTGPTTTEKTFTLPNANATLARTDAGQTFTGVNVFTLPTITTGITPTTDGGAYIGTTALKFGSVFLNSGSVINFNAGDITLTHSTDALTLGGGSLQLGTNNLGLTGSIGLTGSRVTKGWFTDLEVTNAPTINGVSIATTYLAKTDTTLALSKYLRKNGVDHIGWKLGKIVFFNAANDTLDVWQQYSGRVDLYAAMDTVSTIETDYRSDLIRSDLLDYEIGLAASDSLTGPANYASDHRADLIEADLNDYADITNQVLISVVDTTVTAIVGRIVFKTSDTHFYGCRKLTNKKWYQLDN